MLLLSGGSDIKKALKELNIVISTISFEVEPCAFEKARELSILEKTGSYQKTKYENINSILKGIREDKGNVKLVFEKLDENRISFTNNRKQDMISIAQEIDQIVYKNYQLWKTNYMAFDILHNDFRCQQHYTREDIVKFKQYLKRSENEDIYYRLLRIYANPVYNKNKAIPSV